MAAFTFLLCLFAVQFGALLLVSKFLFSLVFGDCLLQHFSVFATALPWFRSQSLLGRSDRGVGQLATMLPWKRPASSRPSSVDFFIENRLVQSQPGGSVYLAADLFSRPAGKSFAAVLSKSINATRIGNRTDGISQYMRNLRSRRRSSGRE